MCHAHKYTVTVKTLISDEINIAKTPTDELIIAQKDSSFWLELKNDADEMCDVSVTIGQKYVGTYTLPPRSIHRLGYKDHLNFSFSGHLFFLASTPSSFEDVIQKSSVIAAFLPTCGSQQICVPKNPNAVASADIVCYSSIDWSKVVVVKIPILLRESKDVE